jgi:MFS family permease
MTGSGQPPSDAAPMADSQRGTHHAVREGERWLRKTGLRLLAYLIAAFLFVKLIPGLREAVEDLEKLSGAWLVAVFVLEILSETGFVISWHAIVDPENRLGRDGHGGGRMDVRLAWAQLGAGMFIPGGSLSSVSAGTWLLHKLGLPFKRIAERQLSLSFLNTGIDAIALMVIGLGLAVGVLHGSRNLLLTALPAAVAAAGVAAALIAAARIKTHGRPEHPRHARIAVAITTLAQSVQDTRDLLVHRSGWKAVAGALGYLFFDVLVLFTVFKAIHAHPAPTFGVVVLAYIIGALGGSIPLPASIGSVGGMVGMFILYGVGHNVAVAGVLLYQAVGLLVPFVGGGIAYLLLRRQLTPASAIATTGAAIAAKTSQIETD